MEFKDQLIEFAAKSNLIRNDILNEEATKMSLVVPFFNILGYDVFNPSEFCPEYTADVGIKKGEKVDYAILVNNEPIILIEVKSINKKLQKHDSQLFRYFSTTKARLAILTNGIEYRFYSDLSEKNKMDLEPFYEFNISNLSDEDIKEISKFTKYNFDEAEIIDNASFLKYINQFKDFMQTQMQNPSDDFTRFFLKDIYSGVKTQNVIDKFRPILKKAMNDYIDQIVKERMTAIINDSGYVTATIKNEPNDTKGAPTDIELEAFALFGVILDGTVDLIDITYKKTESYFGILYKNNSRKWIARLAFRSSQIILVLPNENKDEIKYKISVIDDLNKYSDNIIQIVNRYLLSVSNNPNDYIYTRWGRYLIPEKYVILIDKSYIKQISNA